MLLKTSLSLMVTLALGSQMVLAQVGSGARQVGGGVGGSTTRGRLTTQSGQSETAAVMRESRQDFVGGATQADPRSLGGGTGMGGMGGLGGMSGLSGMGMMGGMGLGGMGMGGMGMGGMMGGRGMGMGGGMMGGRGNMMNQGGMMGGMGGTRGMGGMQQNRMIRTPLRIGSGVIRTPMGPRVGEFQDRLGRIPTIQRADQIAVSMDGSVVVLQGAVATPRDRELVARLIMLEPGVREIRNELIVLPAP
jgi:hypothetical protein